MKYQMMERNQTLKIKYRMIVYNIKHTYYKLNMKWLEKIKQTNKYQIIIF